MDSHSKMDEKEFQPFLRLGKYLPESFITEAVELLFLVSEYGISKVGTRPTSRERYLEFTAHVHDGWKQAQNRISTLLTDALAKRDGVLATAKKCRRLRDKDGDRAARRDANQIEVEIKVLRRTLDVILWTILAGEHSTLRRLFVVGGQNNISAKNIADAMPTANRLNQDPYTIAICTDMLSLVHVGDLLVADRKEGQIRFVELKAGRKNAEISNAAQLAVTSGCEQFESFTTSEFDETDVKHYKRVKRQIIRNRTILDTIRNEGGMDHNTGAKVQISVTDGPPELWSDTIMRCYSQLNDAKTWAIAAVDECVYVGVYSKQDAAFVGFKAWMRQMKCESPIYNLTDSFRIPSARPLGATFLSPDLQKKVLRGEILVIICLDILNLIKMATSFELHVIVERVDIDRRWARLLRQEWVGFRGSLSRCARGTRTPMEVNGKWTTVKSRPALDRESLTTPGARW